MTPATITSAPTTKPWTGRCRRFRIAGICTQCGEEVIAVHVDSLLHVWCGQCCPSCADQRRRVGHQ
jgi:hypothetical protein